MVILFFWYERVHAKDSSDKLVHTLTHRLGDNLVDRALMAWTNHGGLDDTTCAKPEAWAGEEAGDLRSLFKSKRTKRVKARFNVSFLHAPWTISRSARPYDHAPRASVDQVFKKIEVLDLHIPTLLPVYNAGRADEGLEYLDSLAAGNAARQQLIDREIDADIMKDWQKRKRYWSSGSISNAHAVAKNSRKALTMTPVTPMNSPARQNLHPLLHATKAGQTQGKLTPQKLR